MLLDAGTKTIVYSPDQLPDLSDEKRVCFDCETISFDDDVPALDPYKGHRVAGLVLKIASGDAWYIPLRNRDNNEKVFAPFQAAIDWLNALFARKDLEAFGHNVKFDMRFLAQDGIIFNCTIADTMVLGRLVDNVSPRFSLDFLAERYELPRKDDEEVKAFLRGVHRRDSNGKLILDKKGQPKVGSEDYGIVPVRKVATYAFGDAHTTYELRRYLESQLPPFSKPLWEIEKQFTPILFEIEHQGVRVDVPRLYGELKSICERLIDINQQIDAIAGWEVDPNKDSDKTELFIKQLKVKPTHFTATGKPQWTKNVLSELVIPDEAGEDAKQIGNLFRAWAMVGHFSTTYVEGWLNRVDVNGYLHPDLRQQGTITGRLSCGDPNTQNIPPEAEMFVIAPDGYVIVSFDFSQIEYRVFAHYTGDPAIKNAYIDNPDADFHQGLADFLGIPRQFAKTLNFGLLYGMGKTKLLNTLVTMMTNAVRDNDFEMMKKMAVLAVQFGLSDEVNSLAYVNTIAGMTAVAEGIFDKYHETYPSIRAFSRKSSEVATYRKYVRNLFGRKYDFDMTGFTDEQRRAFGTHRAVNYLVQGSCADLLRVRMIELRKATYEQFGARPFMTVHDSIYFYVPKDKAAEFFVVAKSILETCPEVSVPIRVEGKVAVKNAATYVSLKETNGKTRGFEKSSFYTGGAKITAADVSLALACAADLPDAGTSIVEKSKSYRAGSRGI